MLYVIPFILLLVVAVFLKRREDANKDKNTEKNKKTNSKANNKNNRVTRTAKTSRTQTTPVQDTQHTQQETSPLNPEFKAQIEKLIAEKNFSSAEIKINQTLNQDNTQHELYLYLLDIHLAHKDDLAIQQLLNHIRMLKLEHILTQASEKQKKYNEQKKASNLNTIDFELPQAIKSNKIQSHANFDALVTNDKSQDIETKPTEIKSAISVDKKAEPLPVEFDLTSLENKILADQPVDLSQELNLNSEIKQTEILAPLEFNFDLTPKIAETAPTEIESTDTLNDVKQPLEFKIDLNEFNTAPIEKTPSPNTPHQDLEFKLTPSQVNLKIDPAPETVSEESINTPFLQNQNLEFHVESSELNLKTDTDFDLNTKPLSLEPLEFTVQKDSSINIQSIDPLVQAFPELTQIDEIELNLELAEQYIVLGAYDSARLLLSQNENRYSPEQRISSQNLMHRIAS